MVPGTKWKTTIEEGQRHPKLPSKLLGYISRSHLKSLWLALETNFSNTSFAIHQGNAFRLVGLFLEITTLASAVN
ncbi:hypothetical protein HKD37_17G048157 [Glycine soja]|uniref:Uncharacterized protein n=1 Tax=Glycine soja TaxID=3848 RepID=A0A0B2PE52_GLYSO|nr:hypothetical protein glysoja_043690 [Glycine soja]